MIDVRFEDPGAGCFRPDVTSLHDDAGGAPESAIGGKRTTSANASRCTVIAYPLRDDLDPPGTTEVIVGGHGMRVDLMPNERTLFKEDGDP